MPIEFGYDYYELKRELEAKAQAEGFKDIDSLAKFLLEEGLKLGIKRNSNTVSANKRPPIVAGDKVRLTKRARNQRFMAVRNATMVVLHVNTTVPDKRRGQGRSFHGDGIHVCFHGSGTQDRRADPSNGYCSIQVAYKHKGKWRKQSFHRKDLYLIKSV